jgi:hypothetical protein
MTRIPRLAFPDPTIVDRTMAGKAPVHLTTQALRSEGSISALWADQRARYSIHPTI